MGGERQGVPSPTRARLPRCHDREWPVGQRSDTIQWQSFWGHVWGAEAEITVKILKIKYGYICSSLFLLVHIQPHWYYQSTLL